MLGNALTDVITYSYDLTFS